LQVWPFGGTLGGWSLPETCRSLVADQEPGNEPGAIVVLAAVIERAGSYLVCRRPTHKRHGGRWEFPGGKLEPGETWLEAARRELQEELDVHVVQVGAPRFGVMDPGSRYYIEFAPVTIQGEPQCLEHEEIRWVTVAQLTELALAPADRRFADYLRAAQEE
jgi:mutator protein MutT